MADGSSTLPLSEATANHNYDELSDELRDRFHVPSQLWWRDVRRTFSQLCEILRPKTESILGDELEDGADEYAITARLAREAALPSVIILPSGTHALELTATDEYVQCVAFGTVTPKLYLELLWESVVGVQQRGDAKIVVHEVDGTPVLRILLSLEGQTFELKYHHCDIMARSYPNILDVKDPFLLAKQDFSQSVQDAVGNVVRERARREYYDRNSVSRKAYYFVRAWVITRGFFGAQHGCLSSQDIISLFENTSCSPIVPHADADGSISIIVRRSHEHPIEIGSEQTVLDGELDWLRSKHREMSKVISESDGKLGRPDTHQIDSCDWNQLLMRMEAEPFHKKMNFPCYVRVIVMYTGYSNTKGGEWLSMVESKLELLRETLQQRISNIPYVRVWPQRLVNILADVKDDVYEGCFVLGFQPQNEETDVSVAMDVANQWNRRVRANDLTIENECFIETIIDQGTSRIEREQLKPCTRSWPLPVLKAEDGPGSPPAVKEGLLDQLSKRSIVRDETKKEQKNNENRFREKGDSLTPLESTSSNPESRRSLRPAMDVLNRLRYDRDYNVDEFVVGYRDRHDTSRTLEKPAGEWTRETTDQEFIPEHRIEYFKRYYANGTKSEVLWEKNTRVDMMFANSGRKAS